MNKITILLPIHQRDDIELNFHKTFNSIINNTFKKYYLLILVDGKLKKSFLNKINLLKKKKKFKIIFSKKVGLPKLLNKGINITTTEWIARVDSDDLYKKDFIKNAIYMINKGYDLFGGQILEKNTQTKSYFFKKLPLHHNQIKKYIKYRNPFNHMTVFFRTTLAKKLGGYPNIYLKEDYAFWIKFLSIGAKVGNSKKIFAEVVTDSNFFRRRSGFKHIISEFQIQKILIKTNQTNLIIATYVFLLRAFLIILPTTVLKMIYLIFLRKLKFF